MSGIDKDELTRRERMGVWWWNGYDEGRAAKRPMLQPVAPADPDQPAVDAAYRDGFAAGQRASINSKLHVIGLHVEKILKGNS